MKQAVKSLIEKLCATDAGLSRDQRKVVKASREEIPSPPSCQAIMSNMLVELRDFDKRLDQKLNDVCIAERQGA